MVLERWSVKKPGDGMTDPTEWVIDVRVGLVVSVPEIWRRLELQASLTLGQVHRVLQVAFGGEDAHLQRFTDGDPFRAACEKVKYPSLAPIPFT